jgi:hypothetical protein
MELFGPRTKLLVIGTLALSLVTAAYLGLTTSDGGPVTSAGADSYSRSAIGHHGLLELLREMKVPARAQRGVVGGDGLLVLAEPQASVAADVEQRLRVAAATERPVLLVLPKWSVLEATADEKHVRRIEPLSAEDVARVMGAAGLSGEIRRPARAGAVERDEAKIVGSSRLDLPVPQLVAPDDNSEFRPLVATAEGALLLQRDSLYVLTDPDLLENHGLLRADDAEIALRLLDHARDGGRVVFDEVVHGHKSGGSLWAEFATFPLGLVTIQLVLLALALAWAGLVRVAKPLALPPPLGRGLQVLVDNTASLLHLGGHAPEVLARYWQATQRELLAALHAPADLGAGDRAAWLARAAAARKAGDDPAAIDAAVAASKGRPAEVLATARRIHRLRTALLHGGET